MGSEMCIRDRSNPRTPRGCVRAQIQATVDILTEDRLFRGEKGVKIKEQRWYLELCKIVKGGLFGRSLVGNQAPASVSAVREQVHVAVTVSDRGRGRGRTAGAGRGLPVRPTYCSPEHCRMHHRTMMPVSRIPASRRAVATRVGPGAWGDQPWECSLTEFDGKCSLRRRPPRLPPISRRRFHGPVSYTHLTLPTKR